MNFNYWKTQDGQVLRVDKMTDSHLQNTINKINKDWLPRLEKEFENYRIEFYKHEWDCPFSFDDVGDFSPGYEILEKYKETMEMELKSRG